MDKPSLKALRELHEKATPGPWEQSVAGIEGDNYVAGTGPWYRNSYKESKSVDDAALIAAARNALPALLAIAEAVIADRKAQEAVSGVCLDDMDSEEAQAAFQQGHDADKALAAALALVEE